jgi:hypothetical protein
MTELLKQPDVNPYANGGLTRERYNLWCAMGDPKWRKKQAKNARERARRLRIKQAKAASVDRAEPAP